MATSNLTDSAWAGKLLFEDTALAVTDTGGPGIPVIYLNGQFTTQFHWKKVIAELGTTEWRHLTYDERARGKSKRSADYSFEAAVRDVDAVLAGRAVAAARRVLVVGWSYGAYVAAHWASRNPDRCLGAVLVDGAYPYDWLDEAEEERIRRLFRQLNWFMPLLRPTGLAPRMTAEQQANSNIELGVISRERELGPVLDRITVPVRYVIASGTSFGSHGAEEEERCRLSIDAVAARNPNIRIGARVSSNHTSILRKESPTVVVAIREVAALNCGVAEDYWLSCLLLKVREWQTLLEICRWSGRFTSEFRDPEWRASWEDYLIGRAQKLDIEMGAIYSGVVERLLGGLGEDDVEGEAAGERREFWEAMVLELGRCCV